LQYLDQHTSSPGFSEKTGFEMRWAQRTEEW